MEYRLSQGGPEAGRAALQALEGGGRFSDWKKAFKAQEKPRIAIDLAREAGKWDLHGIEVNEPPGPKPPKRLPWRGTTPDPERVKDLRVRLETYKAKGASS